MKRLLITALMFTSIATTHAISFGCDETKAGERLITYIQDLKTKCESGEKLAQTCKMNALIRIQQYIGIASEVHIQEAEILADDLSLENLQK